jgi:hypothetical protein
MKSDLPKCSRVTAPPITSSILAIGSSTLQFGRAATEALKETRGPRTLPSWMRSRLNRPWRRRTRKRDFLILFVAVAVAVAVLAVALSACGSSSGGSSTSEHAEAKTTKTTKTPKPVASEPEASTEESGGAAELESIIRVQIYGRWGGTHTEFEVAGGSCKIDKINTSKAAIKAGGEAVLNNEHDASVLVTPIKRNGEGPTAAECQSAVAVAIG